MILFKSVESIKEYREYMKDKMREARERNIVRPKISTVNKKYKKPVASARPRSAAEVLKESIMHEKKKKQPPPEHKPVFASKKGSVQPKKGPVPKPNLKPNNARSEKILEIE